MWVSAGVLGGHVLASLLVPRGFTLTAIGDLIQTAALAGATFAMVQAARRGSGRAKTFWRLFATGFVLWLVMQLLWAYFELVARREVPNPFIGDALLFLHSVPFMAALALRPEQEVDVHKYRYGSIDFSLLLIWWLYLYLFFVIPYQYVVPDVEAYGSTYGHIFNILYLLENLVVIGGMVWLWATAGGRWRWIYGNLAAAYALYTGSSLAANVAIDLGEYYTGSPYDLPLVTAQLWFGVIGSVAAGAADESVAETAVAEEGSPWPAFAAMVTLLSLPLLGYWAIFNSIAPLEVRDFRIVLTMTTACIMVTLLFLKQHLLQRKLLEMLRDSRRALQKLQDLQQQLVQSEKLASIGKLVSGAAHEMNNPLAAVIGYSDLLEGSDTLDDTSRDAARKIGHHARRTKRLVSDLLAFARETPRAMEALDVNLLLQNALQMRHASLVTAGICVTQRFAPGPCMVLGDRGQLLQVFDHIIRNAADAMCEAKEKSLIVATSMRNHRVVMEFFDTGRGIAEPDRVFDPFYTTKQIGRGTGLGLSVCYGVVQRHEGVITCSNCGESGAVFRIEIPTLKEAHLVAAR